MVNKESTKEQVSAYVAALEDEKASYEARIDAAKNGRLERLDEAQLADRISQVDAEVKRAKSLLKKKKDDAEDA